MHSAPAHADPQGTGAGAGLGRPSYANPLDHTIGPHAAVAVRPPPPPLFVSTPNDSPLLDCPPAGAEPIAAGNLSGLGRRQPSPDGPCVPSHVSRGAVRCRGAPLPGPNCLPALLSSSSCWSSLTAALLRILWPLPVTPVLGTLVASSGATSGVHTRSQSTAAACGGRRRGPSASIGPSRTHTAILGLSRRAPLTRRAPSWCLTSSLLAP